MRLEKCRQPEITDPEISIVIDEKVRTLDVTVKNSAAMAVFESAK